MIVLVTGGSGSGKSACAERRAVELFRTSAEGDLSENIRSSQTAHEDSGIYVPRLIYLATMARDPDDPETAARIARHRGMRSGKGFATIECSAHVEQADVRAGDTVLLEDLPNLFANERYMERRSAREIADSLASLSGKCRNLVVVTGIIDCDGAEYDAFTREYIRDMAMVTAYLAAGADEVTEIVAGIPVRVK